MIVENIILTNLTNRFWAFLYAQHRHDICTLSSTRPETLPRYLHTSVPVQNYITAIIIFLIVEMLMTWGFYGM